MGFACIVFALVVGTWNGEWFPSGRAEHRASPEVERATIRAAGRMLRNGLAAVDPTGREDVVLCLNEIRDAETAEALCRAIGRTNLSVAVVTGYRRRDRFDQQQDAILTTLPAAAGSWSRWKTWRDATPPRGYARAELVVAPATTATVYAVHLKSNYGQTTEAIAESNRLKRGRAVGQLVEQERPKRGKFRAPVVVAGDFNADRFGKDAEKESVFRTLEAAGFAGCFEGVPYEERVTHPGRGRGLGSTIDYVFFRGFERDGPPLVATASDVSDHNAVFVRLKPAPPSPAAPR